MERVDVLLRVDICDYDLVIKMLRQRELDKDAVNIDILIELFHKREKLLLGCLLRELEDLGAEADLLARLLLVSHIYLRRRIGSDYHDRETGDDAFFLQFRALGGDLRPYFLRNLFSVNYLCHFVFLLLFVGIVVSLVVSLVV